LQSKNDGENLDNLYKLSETYISGWIKTNKGWRDPTQFTNNMRVNFNEGHKTLEDRRVELLEYLKTERSISPKIVSFIRKNRQIVGEDIFKEFENIAVVI
jgi:hypothetical protein